MVRKNNFISFLLAILLLVGGCKKFLDIQPEDKYTENQVFSSETKIKEALNGLYLNLSDVNLYGSALSNSAVEILARRYNVASQTQSQYYPIIRDYATPAPIGNRFDRIWTVGYATIRKTNLFIDMINRSQGVLSEEKLSIVKGEALAIRAMLHFDLLRLYGPIFTTDSTKMSIPYSTVSDTTKTQALEPANRITEKVLIDLKMAETLLSKDMVKSSGILTDSNIDFYNSFRNRRLNYYAVRGLLARVYLYRGNKNLAHDMAKNVLDEGEKWFPWITSAAIVSAGLDPDRVFSTEVLFGLYNPNLYNVYNTYFVSTLTPFNILTAEKTRIDLIFEANQNDYRYVSTWIIGSNNIRTFNKFADINTIAKTWRFLQPLIRKSEMYYILAETEPDPNVAAQYLNTVRNNRNLQNLSGSYILDTEIQKEYQKEFWGEGQLFFYYKRKNKTAIPNGTDGNPASFVNNPTYVVPLPVAESQLR